MEVHGTSLDARGCGVATGLAAGAAVMVGIEFICVYVQFAHFAAYHAWPVLLFVVGALTGPKWLRTV